MFFINKLIRYLNLCATSLAGDQIPEDEVDEGDEFYDCVSDEELESSDDKLG